jgi:hypothetical protein
MHRLRRTTLSAAALLLLCLLPALPTDLAGQDAALRARERAQLLSDFEAMLDHSDANMRRAAFEEAMQSDDQALRTMAMDKALGGDDQNLQTAALRALLQERSELAVTVILPDRPTPPQEYTFERFHGLRIAQITLEGNELHWRHGAQRRTGQLAPGGFQLTTATSGSLVAGRCILSARVAEAKLLTGALECVFPGQMEREVGGTRATLPIRIDLP